MFTCALSDKRGCILRVLILYFLLIAPCICDQEHVPYAGNATRGVGGGLKGAQKEQKGTKNDEKGHISEGKWKWGQNKRGQRHIFYSLNTFTALFQITDVRTTATIATFAAFVKIATIC